MRKALTVCAPSEQVYAALKKIQEIQELGEVRYAETREGALQALG